MGKGASVLEYLFLEWGSYPSDFAIASSYGLCSYFGLFYSPLMNVLPFLLLGIGVDDMFVLVNAYDNTNPYLSIAERLGNAMSTA